MVQPSAIALDMQSDTLAIFGKMPIFVTFLYGISMG